MGQHQRLGPQGQLIHTPELTNYEKVCEARLTMRLPRCRMVEQLKFEQSKLMKVPVPLHQFSDYHCQSRRHKNIHTAVLSQTLHSQTLQNSEWHYDGNCG